MTAAEQLAKIKQGMGITGNYQDETLQVHIDSVKQFMLGAGVPQEVVDSPAAIGAIIRGVLDLWSYSSGDAKLSEAFKMQVIQLAYQQTSGGDSNV